MSPHSPVARSVNVDEMVSNRRSAGTPNAAATRVTPDRRAAADALTVSVPK